MPHPILCQDEQLRHYLQSFQALFSRPQFEHFVTVLTALLLGEKGHTLSHLKRSVACKKSVSSLSRFFESTLHGIMRSSFNLIFTVFVERYSQKLRRSAKRWEKKEKSKKDMVNV